MDGRYYWLKLKRDFFKRHDIRIIEEMPNGKDYLLFYMKLLCESVDHNGNLRFSDTIPYSEEMLSIITNTNVDIVHRAVEIFTGLEMMELLDDGTFFMTEVENMTGSCANNDNANRVRRCRERKKALEQAEQKQIPAPKKTNDGFEDFWKAYPKKKAKGTAEKAFEKAIKKTDLQTILNAIEIQKTTAEWKKDSGQYIPYPATWLNAECWNDEVITVGKDDGVTDLDELRKRDKAHKENLRQLAKKMGIET